MSVEGVPEPMRPTTLPPSVVITTTTEEPLPSGYVPIWQVARLDHFIDKEWTIGRVLEEFGRLLKSDGWILLAEPHVTRRAMSVVVEAPVNRVPK